MNQSQDTSMLTVKVAADVRKRLQEWAADNLSSMTTEFNWSVRERAAREQAERRRADVDATHQHRHSAGSTTGRI